MLYSVSFGFKVQVEIIRDKNARVIVHAPMYINKKWEMNHCYSLDFTDHEILRDSDFIRVMSQRFPN